MAKPSEIHLWEDPDFWDGPYGGVYWKSSSGEVVLMYSSEDPQLTWRVDETRMKYLGSHTYLTVILTK